MVNLSTKQKYKPIPNSRRNEILAWAFSCVLTAAMIISPETFFVRSVAWFMVIFFGLSAIFMSIGNWTNRKMWISVEKDKIKYSNGFREVGIEWKKIERVEIYKRNFGDKIRVISGNILFSFDTYGEMIVDGKVRERVGFIEGRKIFEMILSKSGLDGSELKQVRGYSYYTRK